MPRTSSKYTMNVAHRRFTLELNKATTLKYRDSFASGTIFHVPREANNYNRILGFLDRDFQNINCSVQYRSRYVKTLWFTDEGTCVYIQELVGPAAVTGLHYRIEISNRWGPTTLLSGSVLIPRRRPQLFTAVNIQMVFGIVLR
jgi:hypothetical protein